MFTWIRELWRKEGQVSTGCYPCWEWSNKTREIKMTELCCGRGCVSELMPEIILAYSLKIVTSPWLANTRFLGLYTSVLQFRHADDVVVRYSLGGQHTLFFRWGNCPHRWDITCPTSKSVCVCLCLSSHTPRKSCLSLNQIPFPLRFAIPFNLF